MGERMGAPADEFAQGVERRVAALSTKAAPVAHSHLLALIHQGEVRDPATFERCVEYAEGTHDGDVIGTTIRALCVPPGSRSWLTRYAAEHPESEIGYHAKLFLRRCYAAAGPEVREPEDRPAPMDRGAEQASEQAMVEMDVADLVKPDEAAEHWEAFLRNELPSAVAEFVKDEVAEHWEAFLRDDLPSAVADLVKDELESEDVETRVAELVQKKLAAMKWPAR